jgi:hypothetical protein
MPKEKEFKNLIPKIYKRNAENTMLFAWVKAQKQIVPTITLDQSIMSYFKHFGITLDEWDIECARNEYIRMQKDYFEDCRS